MKTSRKDDLEPYWQDEKDWLFASDIIGHLFGYAHLTNTRSLALVGNPEANAYELLFSFSSSEEKGQFLELILCLAQMSSLEKWRDCFSPKPELLSRHLTKSCFR